MASSDKTGMSSYLPRLTSNRRSVGRTPPNYAVRPQTLFALNPAWDDLYADLEIYLNSLGDYVVYEVVDYCNLPIKERSWVETRAIPIKRRWCVLDNGRELYDFIMLMDLLQDKNSTSLACRMVYTECFKTGAMHVIHRIIDLKDGIVPTTVTVMGEYFTGTVEHIWTQTGPEPVELSEENSSSESEPEPEQYADGGGIPRSSSSEEEPPQQSEKKESKAKVSVSRKKPKSKEFVPTSSSSSSSSSSEEEKEKEKEEDDDDDGKIKRKLKAKRLGKTTTSKISAQMIAAGKIVALSDDEEEDEDALAARKQQAAAITEAAKAAAAKSVAELPRGVVFTDSVMSTPRSEQIVHLSSDEDQDPTSLRSRDEKKKRKRDRDSKVSTD
ncbi:protein ORF89 [Cyprinid herpesvirus 2]|uniref:Protein ORF89 n=1 Tax=Cyprinid herpesvirus 2 TaxID=317878 RepID=K7PC05_CYHV2|nr:protein ORF89 [Cyprinid herpesvirus 2]AFJ20518.1 protein ORF89 [Cyprinid herpesvirus 2]